MSDKDHQEETKCYIPVCTENCCDGILEFKLDVNSFTINATCDKDNKHRFENIHLGVFNKYFLRELIHQKCNNCEKNINNDDLYRCNSCNKFYCSICYESEIHIKNDKKNLEIIKNKDIENKIYLSKYCADCKQNIYNEDSKSKDKKDQHINHNIKYFKDIIPRKQGFNELKEKIIGKSKAFDLLIGNIKAWQNKFNEKISSLIKNLQNEIEILKKLFLNLKTNCDKYTYYSNFNKYLSFVEDYNNENLKDFISTSDFDKKTEFISKVLFYHKENYKKKEISCKEIIKLYENDIISNFSNDSFLFFSFSKYELNVIPYKNIFNKKDIDDSDIDKLTISKLKFNKRICHLSSSDDFNKIYACLYETKSVQIFNYNINDKTLSFSDEFITLFEKGHFTKCIYLEKNLLSTICDNSIFFWSLNNNNQSKNYINTKTRIFQKKIYDICKLNNEYLAFTSQSNLICFNLKTYEVDKNIPNLDCIKDIDTILIISDFIFVNCEKGIAIIFIKTMEKIQYIENYDTWNYQKIITKSVNNKIYVFNEYDEDPSIYVFNLIEKNVTLVEIMKILRYYITDEDNEFFEENDDNMVIKKKHIIVNDNNNIIIWHHSLSILTNE